MAEQKATYPTDLDRLHDACRRGADEYVTDMIQSSEGQLLNERGGLGNMAIHWASSAGHTNVVEALCKLGANVNAKNSVGDTPLHLAAWRGHAATVRALLEHGADKNQENKDRKTPCDMAKKKDVVALLPEFTREEAAAMVQIADSENEESEEEA